MPADEDYEPLLPADASASGAAAVRAPPAAGLWQRWRNWYTVKTNALPLVRFARPTLWQFASAARRCLHVCAGGGDHVHTRPCSLCVSVPFFLGARVCRLQEL